MRSIRSHQAPRAWLAGIAAALLSGCVVAPPDVDAGRAIAEAVPAAGAIEFRTDGGPLDETDASSAATEHRATLPLADAIRLALQRDPGLQVALARVRVARAEAEEAGLPPDPVLSVLLRFPEGGGSLQAEAGLGAGLVALLQTPRRASAAHHRLRAEAARSLTTALDLLHDVQTHYTAAQALESRRSLLDERLAILARHHDVAAARLQVGEGTRAEVSAFEAERLALEIGIAAHANDLRQQRLELARLIGEPSSAAAWTLEPFAAPAVESGDEAGWIAAALAHRPDVRAAEWELLALGDDLDLASGSAFADSTLGIGAEKDDDWSAGPALAVPLPLFGRAEAREDAAFARVVEGRHRLTEARRGAVLEVRSALEALEQSAAGVARLQAELIPLHERRRADVQRAFDARAIDVTDLLRVDAALAEARAQLVELQQDAATARIRLQRAVGGPAAFEHAAASRVAPAVASAVAPAGAPAVTPSLPSEPASPETDP